jgi:hypothetical protein
MYGCPEGGFLPLKIPHQNLHIAYTSQRQNAITQMAINLANMVKSVVMTVKIVMLSQYTTIKLKKQIKWQIIQ